MYKINIESPFIDWDILYYGNKFRVFPDGRVEKK